MENDDLEPRSTDGEQTLDAALAAFGFRDGGVRAWIIERTKYSAPSWDTYPERPRDEALAGWRWAFRGRGEYGAVGEPTHFWIPASGGYVATGFFSGGEEYPYEGRTLCAPPGWRISHRITRTRLTFVSITELNDDTVGGFGTVDAGWLPVPDRTPRGACPLCFMELTPAGECVNCD